MINVRFRNQGIQMHYQSQIIKSEFLQTGQYIFEVVSVRKQIMTDLRFSVSAFLECG